MNKEYFEKYDDYAIREMLASISRKELKKCVEKEEVPSKGVLDTVNTFIKMYELMQIK